MGLPCHHLIQERLDEKDVLHLSDIHPHWHFAKPTNMPGAVSVGQPLLLNPRVVQGKGHPKESRNKKSSTKRRLSAFEVVEKVEKRRCRAGKQKSTGISTSKNGKSTRI